MRWALLPIVVKAMAYSVKESPSSGPWNSFLETLHFVFSERGEGEGFLWVRLRHGKQLFGPRSTGQSHRPT